MKYLNIVALTLLCVALSGSAIANQATVSVNVSCTILPLFEMQVSGPNGGNIEFGAIQKEAGQTVDKTAPEVIISAKSNLGRPYLIKHALIAPLANTTGEAIPDGAMSVDATNAGGGSSAKSQTVGTTSQTLYQSDAAGQSDTITARYNLKVQPQQDAGHYESKLLYTIVTV